MAKKKASRTTTTKKTIETLRHADSRRTNIPTAEQQSVMETEEKYSIRVAYERRNRDLDPQLVWRGKDEQDAGPLVVNAPPLYIQEKVHPKVLIDDLMRRTDDLKDKGPYQQMDLFGDFNGLPEEARSAEFYQHEANWTNRMILGDSLQVMASLAEREGLRGKVQCIYFDPPYGIKFNSNFQWSTTSRNVSDGKKEHITREPEQVKAFRDTWRDGIHSYLGYLRDRLEVCRDLLSDTGSVFVQIGDENVHRVRELLDEVFGDENFMSIISFEKTSSASSGSLASVSDYIVWYAKLRETVKYRQPFQPKVLGQPGTTQYVWLASDSTGDRRLTASDLMDEKQLGQDGRVFACDNLTSQRPAQGGDVKEYEFNGKRFRPGKGTFKTDLNGLEKLRKSDRLIPIGNSLMYRRFLDDFSVIPIANSWNDVKMTGFSESKTYVVQTGQKVIQRCLLMTTDPGDLVIDPTCGSGTTAYVAEQWGRRWITIDTSRVALALSRARIIGGRYPFYVLVDSEMGRRMLTDVASGAFADSSFGGSVRAGFVNQKVPHIMLSTIARNAEIDVIYDQFQAKLEPLREQLNVSLGQSWQEWEIPREPGERWDAEATAAHAEVMALRRECAATMEILESLDLESQQDRLH